MMRLYFLLAQRVPPVPSPVLTEVFRLLERRGFHIEAGIAEETLRQTDQLDVRHDLYLMKSHTELSLSIAGILHGRGARLLNPYPSCVTAQNKIVASQRLRLAGVPVPHSWVTGDFKLLRSIVEEMPVLIKPYQGHRGMGIDIVRDPSELERLPAPQTPVLIQEYIEGTGEDLKVYVVGDEVFAVRKVFSSISFTQPGKPCAVSDEIQKIALRCGQAFGLGLFGLDIIESARGPMVIDLNYFPGYKGVPKIEPRIADYIEGYARGRHSLSLPELTQSIDFSTFIDRSMQKDFTSLDARL